MSLPPAAIVGTEPPPPSVVQLFEAQV
ncbi:MAG: hypothetical protein RL748_2954, partial [Pseudomonadota bacterium]